MSKIVWAVGDAANSSEASIKIGQLILTNKPDKFIYLGDVYASGQLFEYQTHYEKAFGSLKPITSPIPGNHDWLNDLKGYKTYWNDIPDYYAFDLEGWRFYCLDSESPHHPGSPQYEWLVQNKVGPAVLCFHRPRFTEGPMHTDAWDMQSILDIFKDCTTLGLSGHNHNMQDFHPVGKFKQLVSGAGGGGGDPAGQPRSNQRLLWSRGNGFGALKLKVSSDKIDYQFVTETGEICFQNTYFAKIVKNF